MRVRKAARLRNCGYSDGGAGAFDGIADRVDIFAKTSSISLQAAPIRAVLGGKRCAADGITAFGPAPVLALCRQLVAAGYNGRKAGRGWHRYDSNGKRL